MAKITILLLMYADLCIGIGFYVYLLKIKKIIGFQLGMNISVVMGGMAALLSGILLIMQYPFHFTLITIVSTLVGLTAGALFGWLFDYHAMLMGLTNGMIVGLMAPMIGTVLEMPSVFVWFIHILFIICILNIFISIKRS